MCRVTFVGWMALAIVVEDRIDEAMFALELFVKAQEWKRRVTGTGAWGAGAEVEVAARAGAVAAAGALEVVIFRAREGAGGHQMRGGWGLSSLFRHCESDRAGL